MNFSCWQKELMRQQAAAAARATATESDDRDRAAARISDDEQEEDAPIRRLQVDPPTPPVQPVDPPRGGGLSTDSDDERLIPNDNVRRSPRGKDKRKEKQSKSDRNAKKQRRMEETEQTATNDDHAESPKEPQQTEMIGKKALTHLVFPLCVARLGINAAATIHNATKAMYIEFVRRETGLSVQGSTSLQGLGNLSKSFIKPLKALRNSAADVTVELLQGINDPGSNPMRSWVLVIPLSYPSPTAHSPFSFSILSLCLFRNHSTCRWEDA